MSDYLIVDQGDVQGFILRGYHMQRVRHFTLKIIDADKARLFIKWYLPRVTTAEQDNNDPKPCFNFAFTYGGLHEIGLADRCAEIENEPTFKAFKEGAIRRAADLGDVGPNAPKNWREGIPRWKFHVLMSVYAKDDAAMDECVDAAREHMKEAFEELGREDPLEGAALPGDRIHFGYRDGIGQPIIAGVPLRNRDDGKQEDSPPGAFLLGYPSQWKEYSYPPFHTKPPDDEEEEDEKAARLKSERFWRNGSFVAFRVLKQDVQGFEAFLSKESARTGLSRELIAAKLCGRWRNGYPLELAPTVDSKVPELQMNNFDYAGDGDGLRCPFGAHIRRSNPRNDLIASNAGNKHRIIRRGMPYGPLYAGEADNRERGLLGMFICVNLQDQYEFIVKNWINQSGFNGNLAPHHKDPLIGSENQGREFLVPRGENNTALELSQFVTTRGGAYCFIPSMTALRYIANLKVAEEYPLTYQKTKEARIIQLIGKEIELIRAGMRKIEEKVKEAQEAAKAKAEAEKEYAKRLGKVVEVEEVVIEPPRYFAKRMVHRKGHGSVIGEFRIREDLPEELWTSVFKRQETYTARIRFSNADMVEVDDKEPDLRGMAIKLVDADHKTLQDFILVSHSQFFSRDPNDFLALIQAMRTMFETAASKKRDIGYLTNDEFQRGITPYLAQRKMQAKIFKEMQLDMVDPLDHAYYSQTPYRYGPKLAVKYKVSPPEDRKPLPKDLLCNFKNDENRLREALQAHLAWGPAVFNFYVQVQTDPASMPIEDAIAEWDEGISPWVPVATLTIKQGKDVVTDELESWSFNPWNGPEDHRPLGGINRVRELIYGHAAERRGLERKQLEKKQLEGKQEEGSPASKPVGSGY